MFIGRASASVGKIVDEVDVLDLSRIIQLRRAKLFARVYSRRFIDAIR